MQGCLVNGTTTQPVAQGVKSWEMLPSCWHRLTFIDFHNNHPIRWREIKGKQFMIYSENAVKGQIVRTLLTYILFHLIVWKNEWKYKFTSLSTALRGDAYAA